MKMMLSVGALAALVVAVVVGYSVFKPPAQATAPISAAPIAQTATSTAASQSVFEIDQNASSARFVIDEVLRGAPTTVVGTTNQVAGQIAADLDDLDTAQVGTIRINARTLMTDAESRNRMIQNQILQTGDHEYITFTPKQMVGLPEQTTVGKSVTFKMVGDLTIRGTAREATFDVMMTPTTENRLEGSASTSINYADWGVSVPQVPSVTGLAEKVDLHLDFVANAA